MIIPTLQDIEKLASFDSSIELKKYSNGYNIKQNGKTVANIYSRSYGLSYQKGKTYEKITDLEELKNKFDGNWQIINPETGSKKPIKPTISIPKIEISEDDKSLIPQKFKYFPRSYANSTDYEIFSQLVLQGKNILLEGPTGAGKSTLAEYFCYKQQLPYMRIPLNGGATVEDIIGHYILKDGETIWVDGLLLKAVKNGYITVLDELNSASPEITFCIHSLLDHEKKLIVLGKDGGEIVTPHKNFRFIATQNPAEQGYSGINELNPALRDRFHATLFIDYSESVEKKILKDMNVETETRDDIINFFKKLRTAYSKGDLISKISTRSVMNFADLQNQGLEEIFLGRFQESEKTFVSDLMDMLIYKQQDIADDADKDISSGD